MKIVVDTSLLIDFTRGIKMGKGGDLWTKLVEYSKKEGHQLVVPTIAVFEFFSGSEMEKPANLEKAKDLLKDTVVMDLEEKTAEEAAFLYRKTEKSIGVVDYILAATSITCQGQLATLNQKHFKDFKELRLFDFKELN